MGRLLPALLEEDGEGPFVALGVAYALLGLGLVLFGSLRERAQAKALAEGGFAPLSRALVMALTAYLALLGLATMALVRLSPGFVRRRREGPDPMIASSLPYGLDRSGTYRGPEDRSGR